ncbi:MAG: L-aspartate oxidase [Bacteroidetes bacterium]|nr:L-aspartate oxidase [Bacteroidota bacterium]
MKTLKTDILVLGSGIAGLSFAIKAAKLGKVCIATKAACAESNTRLAQGGIASVQGKDDSFKSHIQDTLTAGAGHCDISAVEMVVKKAPKMIDELYQMGVKFNLSEKNTLDLGKEGGHSHNRIVHVEDRSGMAVENILLKKARENKNITFYEYHFAIDFVKKNKKCTGAIVWDIKNNVDIFFNSKITVLATGGAGQVYKTTTNPPIATGDGIAMAYNADVKISDMEFVQFHPTSLFHPKANGFLISEALRGFGAELSNKDGKPFMNQYHEKGSLAPRDVVSRAIFNEMKKNKTECMYLNATLLDSDSLKKNFPSIYNTCLGLGIDITKQLIPIIPAAHYICGGVKTNLHGQTSLDRLFALGEVSCTGLHGANRLASNSLLEGLVFADAAINFIKKNFIKLENIDENEILDINFNKKPLKTNIQISKLENKIRETMWKFVGIVRKAEGLKKAELILNEIEKSINLLLLNYKKNQELIELRNLLITSKIITSAAIKRKHSLGTHFIIGNQ